MSTAVVVSIVILRLLGGMFTSGAVNKCTHKRIVMWEDSTRLLVKGNLTHEHEKSHAEKDFVVKLQ